MSAPSLAPFASLLSADTLQHIRNSATEVLSFDLAPARNLPPTASRVGGSGYWPSAKPYPTNPDGHPLALLAQFNLGELPPHPDLPDHGILAFYIDPFHDNFGMAEDGADTGRSLCVYFDDISAPALSPQAQQQLLQDARAELGIEDEDEDWDGDDEYEEEEYEPDPETAAAELAFQSRWQHEAEAVLQEWLAKRDHLLTRFPDTPVNPVWQQERAALPPLGELVAAVNAYADGEPVNSWRDIGHALMDDYFPATQTLLDGRDMATDPAQIHWSWLDDDLNEEALAQQVYIQQVFVHQGLTNGDARWLQYWLHNPRAVIEADWQMQEELLAQHPNPEFHRQWQQHLPGLQARIDDIIARAHAQTVCYAQQLDNILNREVGDMVQAMRDFFYQTDDATRSIIRSNEVRLLSQRMERLAAHFAELGFKADAAAPDNVFDALTRLEKEIEQVLTLESAGNSAQQDVQQIVQQFDGFGLFDDDEDEQADTGAWLADYMEATAAFVAAQNQSELNLAWQQEEQSLQQSPPQNRTMLMMYLGMGSPVQAWCARNGLRNPAAEALHQRLNEDNGYADDFQAQWMHPVRGEFAVRATKTVQYLLDDNVEFDRHYGLSLYQWQAQQCPQPRQQQALEQASEALAHPNHLLGYPAFCQWDPRDEDDTDTVLLLQLASTDTDHGPKHEVLWGDVGIGHFFIRRQDLQNRRFERAWLHWDN